MQNFYRITSKMACSATKKGRLFAALLLSATILSSPSALAADSIKQKLDLSNVSSWPIDFRNSIQVELMQNKLIEVKLEYRQLERRMSAAASSVASANKARYRAEKQLADLQAKLGAMPEEISRANESAAVAEKRAESAEKRVMEMQAALDQKSSEIADGQKEIGQLAVRVAELKRSNASLIASLNESAPVLGKAHFTATPSQNPSEERLNAWYLRQVNQKIMDAVHHEGGRPPIGTVCFTIAEDGVPVIAPLNDESSVNEDMQTATRKIERLVKMAGPFHPLLGDSSQKVLQLAFKYSLEDDKPSLSMHLAMKPSATQE
jgi:chromosome segregation ATPase